MRQPVCKIKKIKINNILIFSGLIYYYVRIIRNLEKSQKFIKEVKTQQFERNYQVCIMELQDNEFYDIYELNQQLINFSRVINFFKK